MLPFLDSNSLFPSVELALEEPNGLLAAGADLSSDRLISAYSSGIFPWYSKGEPILWWSPNPRTVFLLDSFKPSRSLCRFIRKCPWRVSLNKDFEQVVDCCSAPRKEQSGTWITDQMKEAYLALHQLGIAHSVEVWHDKDLVGGIYGVSIGHLFCGESMFSACSNGSKVSLACLIGHLATENFPLIDCQMENPHLSGLGATNISRNQYLETLQQIVHQPVAQDFWKEKELDANQLVKRKSSE